MQGRADKVVAALALLTRSEAQATIRRGSVTVDGAPCRQSGEKVDTARQAVLLEGRRLTGDGFVYLMLNKPAGVLSATEDRRGDPTVLDLLPEVYRRIAPGVVGRLDKDTQGLILLTDNGTLNHRLTSPRYHADKRYFARVDGPVTAAYQAAFAQGMDLGDFVSLPGILEFGPQPDTCWVTIWEGKFHQIKRMFQKCGREVLALKRLSIGPLVLDEALQTGEFRPLGETEISALLQAAGMV